MHACGKHRASHEYRHSWLASPGPGRDGPGELTAFITDRRTTGVAPGTRWASCRKAQRIRGRSGSDWRSSAARTPPGRFARWSSLASAALDSSTYTHTRSSRARQRRGFAPIWCAPQIQTSAVRLGRRSTSVLLTAVGGCGSPSIANASYSTKYTRPPAILRDLRFSRALTCLRRVEIWHSCACERDGNH